jgi:hypothetical protein
MNQKTILTEATLVPPVFSGADTEIASATQSWASIVSTMMDISSSESITDENKKAIFVALVVFVDSKLNSIDNVTPPVVAQPMFVAPCEPSVATAAVSEPVVSYAAESKIIKESSILKRMRELAGISHPLNRV